MLESHATEGAAAETAAAARRAALLAKGDRLLAAIDRAVARQTSRILHHPDFQAMEARWRGLTLLLRAAGNAPDVKVRILDADWPELSRSMERSAEFDQSRLFDLVYNEEFGMAGGEPFGLLVGDYALSHRPGPRGEDPVGTLGAVASVAAAAFCPFVAGASPELLGLRDFADLDRLPDVSKALLDPALERWRRLRTREDTRFVGLVAPRILLRGPHAPATRRRVDGFGFSEDGAAADGLLWGNGAFGFAALAIGRFRESGWFADMRGAPQDEDGGGLVPALGPFDLGLESAGLAEQPAVEVRFTGAQEQAISEEGLIPAATTYLSSRVVFNSNPSLHRPQAYDSPHADQNARLAAMLQYVLCASRFAHYLKVILRDELGRLADAGSVRERIETWLAGYTLGNDDASPALRTRHPLRLAAVEVEELRGRPGAYSCQVRLQPHFQLDDVSTSFHLVAETLPAGAGATARAVA
ncbi:type VI secretion system contractile sheath large subunit [Aureimonas leprariae]|uniref:Type VI secretion system contractile sheath large subunit n=1 Tax=Plantimonas leprariae TaxID=2615207 RepID=A0A7V7U0D8_9HYPH|nr:type VI secretion system contractile sheath large subunit [Aureimonas leprariae]KAB0680241.1 type VI secretion system contractile sheath large subunit [Aureimonas leprariae]